MRDFTGTFKGMVLVAVGIALILPFPFATILIENNSNEKKEAIKEQQQVALAENWDCYLNGKEIHLWTVDLSNSAFDVVFDEENKRVIVTEKPSLF